MITGDQLVCHLVGDYVFQSDYMARMKTTKSIAALAHVLTYMLPFLLLRPSFAAWVFIVGTHFVIDRWRLARYVVWVKNFIGPRGWNLPWPDCSTTGYPPATAPWLAFWLLIIVDNVLHICCNGLAVKYL